MDASLTISIVSAVGSVACAYLVYRSNSRASTIEDRKVDIEAYNKANEYLEKQLDRAMAQADRLQVQVDKLTSQLASEQDVSNTLRNNVRALQSQVQTLNETISELRSRVPMGKVEHLDGKVHKTDK